MRQSAASAAFQPTVMRMLWPSVHPDWRSVWTKVPRRASGSASGRGDVHRHAEPPDSLVLLRPRCARPRRQHARQGGRRTCTAGCDSHPVLPAQVPLRRRIISRLDLMVPRPTSPKKRRARWPLVLGVAGALDWSWAIASFRCDAEFGRYRGTADIDQATPIMLDL